MLHSVPCPAYFGRAAKLRAFRLNFLPCPADTFKAGDTKRFVIRHHIGKGYCADSVRFINAGFAYKQIEPHIVVSCVGGFPQNFRYPSLNGFQRFHFALQKWNKGGVFSPPPIRYFFLLFRTCKKIKPPMIKATNAIAIMVLSSITYSLPSSFS